MSLQAPFNLEAEQAVLGGLLYDPHAAWAGIEDGLAGRRAAGDVYEPLHGELFDAVGGSIAAGLTPDVSVLARRFSASPAFQALGGERYFADLLDLADLRRVGPCAREVADTSLRRSIVRACAEATQRAGHDADAEAEAQVFDLERAFAWRRTYARGAARARR